MTENHDYPKETHMHTLNRPRFAAGILVTFALLTTACSDSDPASRINAPSLLSSSNNGQSAGNDRHRGGGRGGVSDFAVLARTAVTCTGGSIIGDVGTFLPTGFITPSCALITTGTVHTPGDAASVAAYNAFLAEYERLEALDCENILSGNLAGVTLTQPGVYCVEAISATTGGTLTLSGPSNGIWIFKIGTSGTGYLEGTNFSVVMTNGDPCNVTWWVDEYAELTDSHFMGTILAGAYITTTRGTFNGNAWAGASGVGDVTITGTAVTGCEGRNGNGHGNDKDKCNQGVGNGPEGCDPGKSNHGEDENSNDENGGEPGSPGRQGGHKGGH